MKPVRSGFLRLPWMWRGDPRATGSGNDKPGSARSTTGMSRAGRGLLLLPVALLGCLMATSCGKSGGDDSTPGAGNPTNLVWGEGQWGSKNWGGLTSAAHLAGSSRPTTDSSEANK